jgi:hypothetical protein
MTQQTETDDAQNEQKEQPRYNGPSALHRYFWYFVLLCFSLLSVVVTWVLASNFIDVTIPPQLKLFTTVYFTGSLLFVVPSILICSWLWSPRPYFVVDIDAHRAYFALYRLSEKAFNELEVLDGEPFVIGPKIISVRRYDIETNTAKGTWRGSKDDLELLRKLQEVEELKTSFENLAKRGLAYRSKYTKIIYDSVTRIHTAFLLDFETEVFKSGHTIQNAVSESIDANLPDLEPEPSENLDLNDLLEDLDLDGSDMDFNDLDSDPFSPPTPDGVEDDDLNPRSTRWSDA